MTGPLKIGQPRFLSKEEVLTLHRASLDAYGGADGFLNEGALDSALAQARQGFGGQFAHAFPFGMAAAYGFHIAMNHAFRDGNKRTAFVAMVTFLRMNGWNFELPDTEGAALVLEIIEAHRDKQWLSDKLSQNSRARSSMELRDFFASIDIARVHEFLAACTANLSSPATGELNQSAEEAAAHIPAVRDLFVASKAFYEGGNATAGANMGNQAMLLLALFRIAEDMGYEW
jgi:death on curing protein